MRLGRLTETMPQLNEWPTEATHRWLGQLDALLVGDDDQANLVGLRANTSKLIGARTPMDRGHAAQEITFILHRALAAAELRAPVSLSGSFIPAGSALDGMAVIGKVLQTAKRDVLIIDPYMDEKALMDFAPLAAEGVAIRLLADGQDHKPTLRPAQQRFGTQYGARRPLQVRLAAPKVLHDRLIVVDDKDTYVLTQSLNAFAARSPAAVVRVDGETSALKINAYAAIWAAATPL